MLQRYLYDINAFSFRFPFNYVVYVFSIDFGLLYERYLKLWSNWKCADYFVLVTLLKECVWSKPADGSLASTIFDDSFLFEACGCTMDGKLFIKERVKIVPKYEISKFVAQSPDLTPCVCFIWNCAKEEFYKSNPKSLHNRKSKFRWCLLTYYLHVRGEPLEDVPNRLRSWNTGSYIEVWLMLHGILCNGIVPNLY